jgi:hypothetical protein
MLNNALLTLILNRITPSTLDETFTFESVVELTLELLKKSFSHHKRLYPGDLTVSQLRILLYFRLCNRLKEPRKLLEFYLTAKKHGVKFTETMYAYAYYGAGEENPDGTFQRFQKRLLEDMAVEGISTPVELYRSFLRGKSRKPSDIRVAISAFRAIESG